ncbi:uncharacterized protein NPIL_116211 [Nephila pilipes]|uniref:Uncharacterized protein n=1 Tax=Nephila pilipes TaxID=299642 RepID=A0A8X6MZK7_NEPPI|nr:uncharacterized protein NPIL_116211 [Nephila pilipes]
MPPLTFLPHADGQTLFEPARLTLVPSCDVHDASPLLLAGVLEVATDAALEEAATAVAAGHAVVPTRRLIAAHTAQHLRLVRRHIHGPENKQCRQSVDR